jgi:pyruvate/2-oxoglutarate dehydrogenase complex dihydrolipoamide dehydrogenase (E3) component
LGWAQAHAPLGVEVTILEGLTCFGQDDPDCAAIVMENLKTKGNIQIVKGGSIASCKINMSGTTLIVVHTNNQGDFTANHLLVAVGRNVNINVNKLALANKGRHYLS